MIIFKILYYAFLNLYYYHKEREVRSAAIAFIKENSKDKAMFTDVCLATVGLKTVEKDQDTIPWYIPLSAKQKSWIEIVKPHGFKIGLR